MVRAFFLNERVKSARFTIGLTSLVILSVFSQPAIANAALYDGNCNANEVCVYRDVYRGTPRSDFLYNYEDMDGGLSFHTFNYPSSCNNVQIFSCRLNDSISSIDSYSTTRSIRFFTDKHYDGYYQRVGLYGYAGTVSYDNQYSSECWNDGGVPYAVDPSCTFAN
jgi:hypothetical protein